MVSIKIPSSMLELLHSLPDEHLAEILIEQPMLMKTICVGVTMELQEIEKRSRGLNHPLS
jgi:hypothetical protein